MPPEGSPRLAGASTEDIARRAGISQPYVFRLFGTKKDLLLAAAVGCFTETLDAMRGAAVGKQGEDALDAMGQAYMRLLNEDPRRLMLQMELYAAASDPEAPQEALATMTDDEHLFHLESPRQPNTFGFRQKKRLISPVEHTSSSPAFVRLASEI